MSVRVFCTLLSAAICAVILVATAGCRTSVTAVRTSPTPEGALSTNPSSQIFFSEVAERSGLRYEWRLPSKRPLSILDTIGNGCAFLDYDADGSLDILLIGPRLALFKGDGKGHFADVTKAVELDGFSGHFLGVAVGDYDNDGFDDLYISGYRSGLLLHNEGGKHFRDVTRGSGIPTQSWGTSAAFADINGDGKLDLFIGNYVLFDSLSQQLCKTYGVDTSCPPGVYDGVPGKMYLNNGNSHFTDVSRKWGLDVTKGKTLGVAFADFDGSGHQSLVLANDEVPGELFLNHGGRFENIGAIAGIAYSTVGQPQAGMGQDWGDFDNDSQLDLAVMTFSTEAKPIYRNEGGQFFTDNSNQLGVSNFVIPYVAFGTKWLDADNDGWLDLMMSNGHTSDNIAATGQGFSFRQPTLFFQNRDGKRFQPVSMPSLDRHIVGRGLATGDFDNDGRVDAVLVDNEGTPLLLHNETTGVGHFLSIRLIGKKSNRNGYGAVITIETRSGKRTRHCHADGSYLSSSDARVHFGLGSTTIVDRISIRWSDGVLQSFQNIPTDRLVTITEGEALP